MSEIKQTQAMAALGQKQILKSFEYKLEEPLAPFDVEVKISHCGICHSDIHLIDNDWGISTYPLVPGHEIVGHITAKGNNVTRLAVGDRVGIGWQCGACLECESCVRGDENLCRESRATCVGHFGGFATAIRVDNRFAFRLPDALPSEGAAPLLCGGITVYTPLRHFEVTPPMRVGVVGIGGLGHLAVQFARAFGCEVTAFSSSLSKETETRQLGAHRFLSSTDPKALEKAAGSLDFILVTVNADLAWEKFINILRPNGTLCFVGIPPSPIRFPVDSLLMGRKRVCASPIGGRATIAEMLVFAARHGIRAQTEAMPLSEANAAIEKVRSNRARYRMVLVPKS